MGSQNQEIGVRGQDVIFDVYFRAYNGGPLVDPDPAPTYTIKDPSGNIMDSGTGVREAQGHYEATYSIAIDAELSSQWKIEWTAYVNGALVQGAWEYFIVVEEGSVGFEGDIIISSRYLDQIKTVIGYPSVDLTIPDEQGNDALITDLQIRTLCIEPALREYFKKFPKRYVTLHEISSDALVEVDFLDDWTFGATDVKVLQKDTTTQADGYGFWEMVSFQKYGSSISGDMYGIRGYNPSGLQQATIDQWNARNAHLKNITTEMVDIDNDSRKITVHTNQPGTVQIDWAMWSNNFADVKFQQIENVVKLSQAYLARKVAYLTSLIDDPTVEVKIDSDVLRTESDTLKEEVYEEWKETEDLVLFRL